MSLEARAGEAQRSPAGSAACRAPALGLWLAWAGLALALTSLGAAGTEAAVAVGSDLFSHGEVLRLELTIAPDDLARLRREPRKDVPAQVRAGSSVFAQVAVHLKGSAGSFRGVDDKPALTLDFTKLAPGQRFHGLSKLHLNNSVEDPSYFNELAGAALCAAAGIPSPRVTHALVGLNGRRLGLYVLKEGFAPEFLARHFKGDTGNLYDTGPGHDVDEVLQRDQGEGADDRHDLLALAAATREPDLAKRWLALNRTLDVDRFVTFMAVEVIACHRDGYCLARNNFRIYHDPGADRLVFLPHGMDVLFGRADATIRPAMSGRVAKALLETADGRRRYRERLATLKTNAFDVPGLHREADALLARLQPLLTKHEARELAEAITAVKQQIAARRRSLDQQLTEPGPEPLRFTAGVARPVNWAPVDVPADARLDQRAAPDGRQSLHLRAGAMTSASWRSKERLLPGRYRFRAEVLTKGVKPLSFGNNQGAGLRVTGATPVPPYQLTGDHSWTALERSFEVAAEAEVELICELRAAGGEAWFALDSLRVEQAQSPEHRSPGQ
jgi:spore coat protein H